MKSRTLGIICFVVLILSLSVPSSFAQETYGLSAEEIAEYPEPNVTQLLPNDTLINDRIYRRIDNAVDFYDAPDGNIVSTMGAGFNFVTVYNEIDGWTETRPGRWLQTTSLTNYTPSRFSGVLLPEEGLPYTAAWVLVNTYPSLIPGGEPSESNPIYLRYSIVSLYSTVEIDGWDWYQIGVDQWIRQTSVARILPAERPESVDTERWVSVDLYEQVTIAYENETPVFATLASSGLAGWETNEGIFHIYVRYERTIMSGSNGQPDFYYLEEVPWTMYFDDDIALHGAYWHDGYGYRRSHGCVNLSITDSNWLYNWTSAEFDFTVENDLGAAVYVYSSGVYR